MKKIIIVSIIIIFIIGDFGSSIIANGIPDPINFFNAKSNEYVIIINVTEDEAMMDGHQFHSNENHLGVGDRQGIAGPWISWLKFDLSSLENKDIISANLFLYLFQENSQVNPPIYIHYSSDDSWSEDIITGSNYPNYNPTYTDYNDEPFEIDNWYSWNVTADVKQELNKNLILSEMLTNHGKDGDKYFVEKEYDSTKRAYLEIKVKSIYTNGIKFINGHGNGTEAYAGYQTYNFNPQIMAYKNPDDLDFFIMHIDPIDHNFKIKWDRLNDHYTKLNDDNGYITLGASSAIYKNSIWYLNISIMFNLNYPEEKLSDIKMECWSGSELLDSDIYKNIFIVRKNLIFNGNLQSSSEYQGPLSHDDWVRNHEKLLFSGLKVVYESDKERSPKENTCQIEINDDLGNSVFAYIDSNGTFELSITAEMTTNSYNNYLFSIIPDSADKTFLAPFRIKVDGTGPTAPANFKVHADSLLDTSTTSDSDGEIYLSWSSTVETDSGIRGYYYGEVGTTPIYTTDTTGQISGLDEGIHNFEVYAEDNVGNIGEKNTASIIIDMTDPVFTGFSPDEKQWNNDTPVKFSVTINDKSGSGIDTGTIEYSILKSGSDEWSTWHKPDNLNADNNYTSVTAEKELNLPEGKDNFIRWRVTDRAGNGPIVSKDNRILIDTKPVVFSGFSPANSENRNITENIILQDTSGISSFEYRLKLTGENDYGPWQLKEISEFDNTKKVSIPMEFPFGNTHKIQFRASDIAGNGIVLSDEYQLKINSIPKVIISSPDPALTYKTSDMVIFDASETTDEDNDTLKYWWESDIMGELRHLSAFQLYLKYGTHRITLRVTDEGGHVVNISFDLVVLPVDTDGDGLDDSEDSDDDDDGMPDYWEYIYGLNPLKNDAQNDKDGDGYTNKEEYNAGTDPSDKDSHPKGLSSSMVSTIIILVVVMLIIIIAMGIGFILYRRNVKKRLIVPEVVSKPGVPGVSLPGGVPTSEALPGAAPSTQTGIALPGTPASTQQPQYLLPEHKMSPEEILYQLDQRLALGEISEETYKKLLLKYEKLSGQRESGVKKKKVKRKKKLPDKTQDNEIEYKNQ